MQTPKNEAGAITERLMDRWLKNLAERGEPKPSTATYNACYEAAYSTISAITAFRTP